MGSTSLKPFTSRRPTISTGFLNKNGVCRPKFSPSTASANGSSADILQWSIGICSGNPVFELLKLQFQQTGVNDFPTITGLQHGAALDASRDS
ncbi:hypothetical protein Tco_0189336 [Tanacetum coccineum]